MKVLEERRLPRQYILSLEAQGGSSHRLFLRHNSAGIHVTADGATIDGTSIEVKFPDGPGYQSLTVALKW